MRLQADQEFQQNDIKKLNTKFNVRMFSARVRGSKDFAAEENIGEFEKAIPKK